MVPLAARRTFRFGAVCALSVAFAYGLSLPTPFLSPLFAILLTATPSPPMPLAALSKLLVLVLVTLGIGLLLTPLLQGTPLSALLLIAVGLYAAAYVSVGHGKAVVGTLLTMGLGLIPTAGLLDPVLARSFVTGIPLAIVVAVVCQWAVYPLFPEDPGRAGPPQSPPVPPDQARWVALRSMLTMLPAVLLAFTNPGLYKTVIMKSAMLAQQGSEIGARTAGRELLGSTFLAGAYAIAFWFALKLWPSLWMFVLWMGLFCGVLGARLYGVVRTRHPPSYWVNVAVTMMILVGPAVEDSLGKDPFRAFLVRFALFIGVTLYAWLAIRALEWLRATHGRPSPRHPPETC